MALVIEDGTGLANSNTYVGVEEARDYALARGSEGANTAVFQVGGGVQVYFIGAFSRGLEQGVVKVNEQEFLHSASQIKNGKDALSPLRPIGRARHLGAFRGR